MRIMLEIDDEVGARIDAARAKEPRVRWIRSAIEAKLERGDPPSLPPDPDAPPDAPHETSERLPGKVTADPRTTARMKAHLDKPAANPVSPPTAEYLSAKEKLAAEIRKDCHHPINRRLGNYCGACGKDLK
jgi:hypothetical protein